MRLLKRDYDAEKKRELTASCGCSLDTLIDAGRVEEEKYHFATCDHGAVWRNKDNIEGYGKYWVLLGKRKAEKALQRIASGKEIYQVYSEEDIASGEGGLQ